MKQTLPWLRQNRVGNQDFLLGLLQNSFLTERIAGKNDGKQVIGFAFRDPDVENKAVPDL